jgi:hypothetical protein
MKKDGSVYEGEWKMKGLSEGIDGILTEKNENLYNGEEDGWEHGKGMVLMKKDGRSFNSGLYEGEWKMKRFD